MSAKYLSSGSCAGPVIGKIPVNVGDKAYALVEGEEKMTSNIMTAGDEKDTSMVRTEIESKPVAVSSNRSRLPESRLYGGVTVNSSSNFSNYTNVPDLQRWNYSLNLNADHINGSQFFFTDYMNYSYLGNEWSQVTSNPLSNLRVYDLALSYKSDDINLWAGRYINNNVAGVGPIDGFQGEMRLGSFTAGAVAGSRPDFYNLSFNPRYPQIGGYVSRLDSMVNGLMVNTIGVFQQFNELRTDRRFVYFQHNSSPTRILNIYITGQVDIFRLNKKVVTNDFSLTNLYASAQIAPINLFAVNLSYSGQRNIIYYQTFGTTLDSILESVNQLRHTVRLDLNIRPFSSTFVLLGTGYSFQQGDIDPTRDVQVTLTQSEIPYLQITGTLTYSRIISNFLNGSVYGITLTKYVSFNSSTIAVGFSRVNYGFGNGAGHLVQNQPNASLTTRLPGNLFMNLYYQGTFNGATSYGSLMGGINARF
ncbi:MAG TPA: hypothetical protein VIS48_10955 [Candidatus Kryptonia bacterium]